MKDLKGRNIQVGDDIVFIHSTRQANLVIGEVREVTDKCVVVRVIYSKPDSHYYGRALNVGDKRRIYATDTNSLVLD